ncbi:MAG: tRNA pseudouridine(38-40) synthase TruA [Chlamydiae bacterium]|nr:tRNA pseudouridine(38-40) synthase TruA [Chlamydiota bacterium]
MNAYKLILAYDGTHFLGWQKTKIGRSIQGSLQSAIFQITQEDILPEAASRTDRGVHAEGQVVSFALSKTWDPRRLQFALNSTLPREIRVMSLKEAPKDFHPTLDAIEKEYHYNVCTGTTQDPTLRLYSWFFRFPISLKKMRKGASFLMGINDFSAFANETKENPICHLKNIEIFPSNDTIRFAITGDRFLYKMVRNIVGTLLYIGCGKLEAEKIPEILASKDRTQSGMTAPAHGLTLYRVQYAG